jgi:HTH-type transcriptional regulator / antitoxin HigA
MKTKWKIIETTEEYEIALRRFQEVFHSSSKSPEETEAKLLALIIEDYENKNFPIPEPDPIASSLNHLDS